jgi:hypothetical protein
MRIRIRRKKLLIRIRIQEVQQRTDPDPEHCLVLYHPCHFSDPYRELWAILEFRDILMTCHLE